MGRGSSVPFFNGYPGTELIQLAQVMEWPRQWAEVWWWPAFLARDGCSLAREAQNGQPWCEAGKAAGRETGPAHGREQLLQLVVLLSLTAAA